MLIRIATVALALAAFAPAAFAQDPAQIVIRVGYSPGGSYDAAARVVADHLGRFLPGNPQIVVENVPGAGSYKLARLFVEKAAPDGSEIAVIASALSQAPTFDPEAQFDPMAVSYIATLSNRPSYCVASKASGITSLDQLLVTPAKVGATGPGSSTYIYPSMIKHALNAPFEIVSGFEGGAEIDLALERGDVQVRCGVGMDSLLLNGMMDRVTLIAEIGPVPAADAPDVAFLLDAITDPATKAAALLVVASTRLHHPFILPPDTPPEVVATYRQAFDAMVLDATFLADAEKRFVDVSPTSGVNAEAAIRQLLAADAATQALARDLVQ